MRMRYTQLPRQKLAILLALGFFRPTHYFSLYFCFDLLLCLYTGSSLYILVLGEKLAVLAPTPPLQSTPRACC